MNTTDKLILDYFLSIIEENKSKNNIENNADVNKSLIFAHEVL